MKMLFVVLMTLFAATSSQAAIDLPRDANGWTVLTPSEETQIVYLAASPTGNDSSCVAYSPNNPLIGDDPFNPTGDVLECATFAKAHELVQWTGPDWILARRGDTFSGGVVIKMSGKSATEPFVFASYGSSGAMPVFNAGSSTNGVDVGYRSNIVIAGIDFYANGRDPNSGDFTTANDSTMGFYLHGSTTPSATMDNILIEGCRFRYFYTNGVVGYNNSSGIVLRRNVILDNYSCTPGHSQGLEYNSTTGGGVIEENIFDHNGWLVKEDGAEPVNECGEATLFNHNIYFGGNRDIVVRDNISSRPSSIAFKFSGYSDNAAEVSTQLTNNLIVDAEVGISVWGEDSDDFLHFENMLIDNNVLSDIGASQQTNRTLSWGVTLANIGIGRIVNNVVINQRNALVGGPAISTRGKLVDIEISGNVFHNLYNQWIFSPGDDENHIPATGNITVSGNRIHNTAIGTYQQIVYDYYDLLDGWVFSENTYYTAGADGTRFKVANTDKTDAQWVTLTGDDSTFSEPTFPDPTRSIETYMASLGETATIDAFIAKARAQDRYNWDTRFTADAVNDYIRAGFGMGQRRLFRNVRVLAEVEP